MPNRKGDTSPRKTQTFICVKINQTPTSVGSRRAFQHASPPVPNSSEGILTDPGTSSLPSASTSDSEAGITVVSSPAVNVPHYAKELRSNKGLDRFFPSDTLDDVAPISSSPGTTLPLPSSSPQWSRQSSNRNEFDYPASLSSANPDRDFSVEPLPLTSSPGTTVLLNPSSPQTSSENTCQDILAFAAPSLKAPQVMNTSSPGNTDPLASSPPPLLLKGLGLAASFFTKGSSVKNVKPMSPIRASSGRVSKRGKKPKKPGMTQLKIDISNRPTTQICKKCGMSFVTGVEEDEDLHYKHHKAVVGGLEWPFESDLEPGLQTVWTNDGSFVNERIVKVTLDPYGLKKGKVKTRAEQLLEMVNLSLGAQELSTDQLHSSHLYLYISEAEPLTTTPEPKRRRTNNGSSKPQKRRATVAAVCVAGRIERAYEVLKRAAPKNSPGASKQKGEVLAKGEGGKDSDDRLYVFTGDDEVGLYCAFEPRKALIGIHRIWTSPNYRRLGLARKLLDLVSKTLIYSLPLDDLETRRKLVAFSQPTESGLQLIKHWLKTANFHVFIE